MAPPNELLALLRDTASILILGHKNADGDAVASAAALGLIVRHLGNDAHIVLPGDEPAWAQEVPGAEMIAPAPRDVYDAVVAVDCANAGRLEELASLLDGEKPCAEIDHHHDDDRICDITYVDTTASAAGVLIYRIVDALEIPLSADLATCIYWAIATDTGFFSFSNTTPEAMEICADAIRAGAEPQRISGVVKVNSLAHQRLKGQALSNIKLLLEGRLLFSAVEPHDFVVANAARKDTEGIVDEMTTIPGPIVYALFKSVGDENEWDVSLRSNTLDCTEIAAHFNGGGHEQASGYHFEGPLQRGRRLLVEAVEDALDHE